MLLRWPLLILSLLSLTVVMLQSTGAVEDKNYEQASRERTVLVFQLAITFGSLQLTGGQQLVVEGYNSDNSSVQIANLTNVIGKCS